MEKNYFLNEYFNGQMLEIPLYQRYYEWKADNCRQLFEDLRAAAFATDSRRNHFFGSIITLTDQNYSNKLVVIDGQQRITTIALLLAAIRDILNDPESNIESEDENLSAKIDNRLREQYSGKILLVSVDKDRVPYESVIKHKEYEGGGSSNILINYRFFDKMVRDYVKNDFTIDMLVRAIKGLYIMPIRLTNEDDAQAVFESINSTGLELQESDKIRNFILMNHPVEYQNRYYKEYWQQIEDNLKETDRVSAFFRHYLVATSGSVPKRKSVYAVFKKKMIDELGDSRDESRFEEKLAEIKYYSKLYNMLLTHNFGPGMHEANVLMHQINRLELTMSYPFFLSIAKDWKDGVISDDEFTKVIAIHHNVLVRRAICSINSTGLNNYYNSLYRAIKNLDSDSPFIEKVKYLVTHRNSIDYPTDADVRKALTNTDLYRRNSVAGVVLVAIEHSNRESGDILDSLEAKPPLVSVEHILPQNKNEHWRMEIGPEDYEDVHTTLLHNIGNLTLTGYNSELSDRPFKDKKTAEGGFNESKFFLNRGVSSEERWNRDAILRRRDLLIERFLKVIPEIHDNCQVTQSDEIVHVTADSDPSSFTNLSVKGYIFDDVRVDLPSMADVLLSIFTRLYGEDPDRMYKLASEGTLGYRLGTEKDEKRSNLIGDNIYLSLHSSNFEKAMLLSDLLQQYGIERESVIVFGYRKKPKRTKK